LRQANQQALDEAPMGIYYYHCDHLGTPRALFDLHGSPVWLAEHDDWGNVTNEYNPLNLEQLIRFQGQHFDAESGLFYNRFRYYDSGLGRYLNQDPIGLAGGLNTFTYVSGNPLSRIDPLGLSTADVAKIIDAFQKKRDEMTQQGYRHPNPYHNNLCRAIPLHPNCINSYPNKYQDCFEQTETMNDYLKNQKYDDVWNFGTDAGPGHAWGYGASSDPNDPIVWFDTRSGQISVGQPCPSCTPWFGEGGYSPSSPPSRPQKSRQK
jgi:RHS repeat-associated protein